MTAHDVVDAEKVGEDDAPVMRGAMSLQVGRDDVNTPQFSATEGETDSLEDLFAGPLGSDPQDGCMFLRPIMLGPFARELLAAIREMKIAPEQ